MRLRVLGVRWVWLGCGQYFVPSIFRREVGVKIIVIDKQKIQNMQGVKMLGKSYRVVRPLFQVHSYLYALVCSQRNKYEVQTAALYVYENEDPSQCLKMLKQKLDIKDYSESNYLIFPYGHLKEQFNDKNISLFFINDYIMPLKSCRTNNFSITEFLEVLHGGLSSLNQLHMRDIIHGNITLNTCYLMRQKNESKCNFAFNILDTNYFTEDDRFEGIEEKLFQSEGQSLGQSVSFKDDLQSLVYVITHLISKGKLLTVQRFQLEWITQTEFSRWKNCQFFKEMIHIVPPELEILIEIYMIAKSMRRNEKPDYLKLMKKVLNTIAADKKKGQRTIELEPSIVTKKTPESKGPSMDIISEGDISLKVSAKKGKKNSRDEIKQAELCKNR